MHPADRPGRPTINATASGSSVQTDGTTTTSAQRLYATAMTPNSSHFASTSQPLDTPLSTCSIVDRDSIPVNSPLPPTPASAPLLPPTSVTANLEPENLQPGYRSSRARKSRQMTGFILSLATPLSMSDGLTEPTLYNHAVQTSSSMPPFDNFKPPHEVRREQEHKVTHNASLGPSHTEGHGFCTKALPPTPAGGEGSNGFIMTSTPSHSQRINLYSGITEDNTLFLPAHDKVSSSEVILIDEVPPFPVPPTQPQQPIASSSFTRSASRVIFQPRPIKPLQALSTSFQDQIRQASQPTPHLGED